MREMVLNHVSVQGPDRRTAVVLLKDIAVGMAQLVRNKIVQSSLRTSFSVSEIGCLTDYSLFDAYQDLRKEGERETYKFLMGLSAKCPLLSEVASEVKDRFLACEAKQLPSEDGEPLVLCAIAGGIAIGFPSDPTWDKGRLTVRFNELLPDESIKETFEIIDNLTRSAHAHSICERYRTDLLGDQSISELWQSRQEIFPNLIFGPEVKLPPEHFPTVVNRLRELDESAAKWREVGGTLPPWTCRVTPESDNLMKNPKLSEARRFSSHRGTRELFEWHARFGNNGRIHLRFDASSQEIEIGYIGPHLPL